MSTTKTPPNRLTYEEHFQVCKFLENEAELVESLPTAAIVALVQSNVGIKITGQQCISMLELVDIDRSGRDEELRAVLTAISKRMSWPWSTLLSEGKKILSEAETKKINEASKASALPLGTTASP